MELTNEAIQKLVLKTNATHDTVRVGVTGGGCVGYEYIFAFESEVHDNDHVFDYGTFNIVIDDNSMPYLEDATLDYVSEGINEFFKIINPKETASCGCGTSINF